jgi:arginyl-tRNA synthetase
MNIFDYYHSSLLKGLKDFEKKGAIKIPEKTNSISVEVPPDKFDADISTNVCMVLSGINKSKPKDIYENYVSKLLSKDDNLENFEIVNPGFVNLKFKKKFWNSFLEKIVQLKEYGSNKNEKTKKYLVEFVSANPTGPLHVGHCRGAVFGDVLSNLLKFNNHNVTKEYYINDHGNQITNFTHSVFYRILELKHKKKFPDDENLYPGEYIKEIAQNIISNSKIDKFDELEPIFDELQKLCIENSLLIIKSNLKKIGIVHDNFVSEKSIIGNKEVEKALKKLKEQDLVFEGKIEAPQGEKKKISETRNQLLFRSTEFGDDKDRPLKKGDDSWTYFAGDLAYHNNKISRNFDILINILGADHAGYIKRISSVVDALSKSKQKIECKVTQLVKLIKDNKPFKMSKRKGDYITLEDLINEVGKDAARFIMLSRVSDVELEFDFEKVKLKSKDNPLYYVQYSYARICSIFSNSKTPINNDYKNLDKNFEFNDEEIKIIRKLSEWPKCIETSINKLEPHRLTTYLYQLASIFHSYWNMGRDSEDFRFLDKDKKIDTNKAVLLNCILLVIKNGMEIVGVDTPENM